MSTTDLYVEDLRQKIVFLKAKDGGDVLADNVMNKILKGDVMRLVHHLIDGGRYGSRTADVGNVHGGSNGNNGAAGSSPPTSSSSQSEDERLNVLLFLRNENKVFKNVNDSIVSTASTGKGDGQTAGMYRPPGQEVLQQHQVQRQQGRQPQRRVGTQPTSPSPVESWHSSTCLRPPMQTLPPSQRSSTCQRRPRLPQTGTTHSTLSPKRVKRHAISSL
jgi:hypothetical protein